MNASGNLFLSRLQSGRKWPLIVAHRGDSFRAPENTLDAARLGWEAGADGWELDVQLTRDFVPVVLHDASLVRTTDVAARFADDPRGSRGFRVADFDWEEVRTLNAGSWFADGLGPRSARAFGTLDRISARALEHYRSGRVGVPSLEEALRLTRELDWLVNVEIKWCPSGTARLLEAVLDQIAATDTAQQVLISSFDHTTVAAADRPGRAYALGILTGTPLAHLADYAIDLVGADAVHVSIDVLGASHTDLCHEWARQSLNESLVKEVKGRGAPILAYTVNDLGAGSLSARLAALGVDGLFTDDPTGMTASFKGHDRGPSQGDPR